MTAPTACLDVGDLHAAWLGVKRLAAIVAGIAEHRIAADVLCPPGDSDAPPDPVIRIDHHPDPAMRVGPDGPWRGTVVVVEQGLHHVVVRAGVAADRVDMLTRPGQMLPKRQSACAPSHAAHAIGAWPAAGTLGTPLGPNRNGGVS